MVPATTADTQGQCGREGEPPLLLLWGAGFAQEDYV